MILLAWLLPPPYSKASTQHHTSVPSIETLNSKYSMSGQGCSMPSAPQEELLLDPDLLSETTLSAYPSQLHKGVSAYAGSRVAIQPS